MSLVDVRQAWRPHSRETATMLPPVLREELGATTRLEEMERRLDWEARRPLARPLELAAAAPPWEGATSALLLGCCWWCACACSWLLPCTERADCGGDASCGCRADRCWLITAPVPASSSPPPAAAALRREASRCEPRLGEEGPCAALALAEAIAG